MTSEPSAPRGRRERVIFVLLAAVGAGLLLFSLGRTWVDAAISMPAPLPDRQVSLSGTELAPLASALGWAGLAAAACALVTRGVGRFAIGVFLLIMGVLTVVVVTAGVSQGSIAGVLGGGAEVPEEAMNAAVRTTLASWWTGAIAGGVLLALAGLLVCARGRAWPGMSSRYDRPRSGTAAAAGSPATRSSTARPSSAEDMWTSMDRGADPTDEPAGPCEASAAAPDHGPSKEQ